jgi:starch synthase
MVTTVSPTHAHELRTRTGGFGLQDTFNALSDRFVGILNGIDYEVWDPASDPDIEARYTSKDLSGRAVNKEWLQEASGLTVDPDVPIIGMSARLVQQKGLDLILDGGMVPRLDAQWIFLGEGQPYYEEALGALAHRYPERVAVRFNFTEDREHKLMAGADLLLMPSLYEPCGLTQMRAQRYGALPVVRRVGGLADTVEDRVTGFVFDEYQPWALEEALTHAIELFKDRENWDWHVREAMERDFSWQRSVELYANVYFRAVLQHLSRL